MRRSSFAIIAIAISTVNWSAKSADNPSPLIGTWRLTSQSMLTSDTNETSRPYGEHPIGYLQYSPGGHMVVFLAAKNIKQPAGSIYSDAERVEIHKAILGAYAGTYRVEGNTVIHHVLASWWPHLIGTDLIRYFELNGNKLTIKTAPTKSADNGKEVVGTLSFERVE
jgi:hypothetical protein